MKNSLEYKTDNKGKSYYDLFSIFLLIIYVLFLFHKIIFSCKYLLGLDFIEHFSAWKGFVYDYVRAHGSLPFWNPYLFSGTPFITNIQASLFYPLGFLYYFVPPEIAYGYSTILHCMLGAIFMYFFMRAINVSCGGSFISSIIFSFNGYFMGHLYAGHLTFVQNYIWIPLIFLFLYKFVNELNLKYVIAAGLVLGIQILGGFPQIAFYTILGCIAFTVYHGIIFLKKQHYREASKLFFGISAAIITGFALAAVQVLPTAEFTMLSTRGGGVSYEFATIDSLHPKEILAFLMPDIFGNPIDKTYWRSREIWHFWESCGYVGILPLFLIFIGLRDRAMNRLRLFFIIMIVVSMFLALGKYNPIYPLIHKFPGFNSFRIPAQIIFLYVFSVAVLSGIGVHAMAKNNWQFNKLFYPCLLFVGLFLLFLKVALVSSPFQFFFHLFRNFSDSTVMHANLNSMHGRIGISIDKSFILFICSTLLIIIWKYKKISRSIFIFLASAIVMMDLFQFAAQFVKTYQIPDSSEKKKITSQLNKNAVQGRIIGTGKIFMVNDGLNHKFPSVIGYDPQILRRYAYFLQSSQDQRFDDRVVYFEKLNYRKSKLLRLLHVKQEILGKRIVKIENNIPYANLVKKVVIKAPEEVLNFMKSDHFDPKETVVFETGYGPEHIYPGHSDLSGGYYEILEYDNANIHIRASTDEPAYLVLSEIFYPGWYAMVDGEKIPILRGNYIFRVIPLKKGTHEIHLSFVSWPFRIGAFISLLTMILLTGFLIRGRKIKKG